MGPLAGVKVVEFAGLVSAPYSAMMLADAGADVIRIERPAGPHAPPARLEVVNRGRRSIALDLKNPEAVAAALRLIDQADILIEGFRPGVMERLGFGPDVCLQRNPRLVYGRVTGWGQTGPLRDRAGHDANYISISGALSMVGRRGENPMPPLGAMGDMPGGIQLVVGVLCAYISASKTGVGQVVDSAMADASISLLSVIFGERAKGLWNDARGTNHADTGSHFYDTYETADGKFISVGAIEPQFHAILCDAIGADAEIKANQMDASRWPEFKERFRVLFLQRTRDEWAAIFEPIDACAMPVLTLEEAAVHPQNVARGAYFRRNGVLEPGMTPKFGGTPGSLDRPPPAPGEHSEEILAEAGFSAAEIAALLENRAAFGSGV
jgi:alpha-methylacyl-CoA racemase